MQERDVGGLRCSDVLASLSEYVDGHLDVATVAMVEGHLRGCPECERFGAGFGEMVVALRSDAPAEGSAGEDSAARDSATRDSATRDSATRDSATRDSAAANIVSRSIASVLDQAADS